MKSRIALLGLILGSACVSSDLTDPERKYAADPHSFARPEEAVVRHLNLALAVDFPNQQLIGKAILFIDNPRGAGKLHLDSRDLTLRRVTLDESEEPATFSLGDPVEFLGRPLIVDINPDTKSVNLEYTTSKDAAAVQWLTPEQTAGKKHPFLFTQSQAILARTWVPIQDSPSIRFTYNATIRVPPALLALMSAENSQSKRSDGVYTFRMDKPIPAYLLALAVGDLEFRSLGTSSGVYAEPSVIEKAAWELADTQKMIAAAESLYGPYRWGRYDVLVLPPSFPFGGMENPRLTFATPTILAGDRSLVALVAHELAHSWSGNLVTNATWNDFWLNEGFTKYFEQRIMEKLYGREYSEMLGLLASKALQDTLEELKAKPGDTHLFLNLAGRDPDEGMTEIAYNKGYFLLRLLEETFGRDRWDAFLRSYFDRFAFQSMDTASFVEILRRDLIRGDGEIEARLNLNEWIHGEGVPANAPAVSSTRFAAVERQAERFLKGEPAKDLTTVGWTTHEWLHFIHRLPKDVSIRQLAELDEAFHLTESGNAEIVSDWFLVAIRAGYEPAFPAIERFLESMGRRKFLKPIYTELAKTAAGKEFARRVYRDARPTYHSISQKTIDDILK